MCSPKPARNGICLPEETRKTISFCLAQSLSLYYHERYALQEDISPPHLTTSPHHLNTKAPQLRYCLPFLNKKDELTENFQLAQFCMQPTPVIHSISSSLLIMFDHPLTRTLDISQSQREWRELSSHVSHAQLPGRSHT